MAQNTNLLRLLRLLWSACCFRRAVVDGRRRRLIGMVLDHGMAYHGTRVDALSVVSFSETNEISTGSSMWNYNRDKRQKKKGISGSGTGDRTAEGGRLGWSKLAKRGKCGPHMNGFCIFSKSALRAQCQQHEKSGTDEGFRRLVIELRIATSADVRRDVWHYYTSKNSQEIYGTLREML